MNYFLTLAMSALFWIGSAYAQNDPSLSGGEQNGKAQSAPKAVPQPEPEIIQISLNNPEGPVTITTGSIESKDQAKAAAAEIAAQHSALPGTPAPQVIPFNASEKPSQLQTVFAHEVALATHQSTTSVMKKALPWYYREHSRRVTFAAIRAVIDGAVTFTVVTSHQVLPIPVAAAYSSVGGGLSGVMQYFNYELLNWLSRTRFLNAIRARGWNLPTPIEGVLAHAEYILRWMTMDGVFLGLSAASMLVAASYYGMHASATDILSIGLFGEISFWAATAEGMSDRLIIKKQKEWEIRHGEEVHRARFKTDLLSGLNSCLAVVLALPSLAGIQTTEILLKGYAWVAGALLVKDWAISKIHSIKAFFGWKSKTPSACEGTLKPEDSKPLSWWPTLDDFEDYRRLGFGARSKIT